MPVRIDDMMAVKAIKKSTYLPTFFDSLLTGSGKNVGVLNVNRNPKSIPASLNDTISVTASGIKETVINGHVKTTYIPLSPFLWDSWVDMASYYVTEINKPDLTSAVKIGTVGTNSLWLDMEPAILLYQETENIAYGQKTSVTKKLAVKYKVLIYNVDGNAQTLKFNANLDRAISNSNSYFYDYTENPRRYLTNTLSCKTLRNASIDMNAVNLFIDGYSLYDGICRQAEVWNTSIDVQLEALFKSISSINNRKGDKFLVRQLKFLETYAIPLELYKNIYALLVKYFDPDDVNLLCKQNLNLLLNNTLNNLNDAKVKGLLQKCPKTNTPVSTSVNFSNEQKNAIKSEEPLVIVQAGAGTGKSTVIKGRIEWMTSAGIKPEDITVLSFTNAAADNITAKVPTVHSMTIAKMVHSIYELNYPTHELASVSTIMNAIDIYFPNAISSDIEIKFKYKLRDILRNERNAFTAMNNFVEANKADVMRVLDTIKQTCLELEIIICYQNIDILTEPVEVQSKYLIIDEVQDTSIFEFIYILKYVAKHNESLFIVGDCSQTLYEFRASNPRALNVLESSGVFTPYKLQTNYRSNGEILEFANKMLSSIEANQYAKISLQPNSLHKPTEDTFLDAVNFHYEHVNKLSQMDANAIKVITQIRCKNYLDDKLAKGEQVAFLAYERRTIYALMDAIKKMYPTAKIANIMSERAYDNTILSSFIKNFWNQLSFAPTQNLFNVLVQTMYSKAQYLVSKGDQQERLSKVQKVVAAWSAAHKAQIDEWQRQYSLNLMTRSQLFENTKECMMGYEIRTNAIRQSLISSRNEEAKQAQIVADADFVFSTIHGAKGLEFEHAVIFYKDKDVDANEDVKRLYYVAFTRAQKSEFVLAYGTDKNSKLEASYKLLLNKYHADSPSLRSPLNIVNNNASQSILGGKTIHVTIGDASKAIDTSADDYLSTLELNDNGNLVSTVEDVDDDDDDDANDTADGNTTNVI